MKKILIFMALCLIFSITVFSQGKSETVNLSDCDLVIKFKGFDTAMAEFGSILNPIDELIMAIPYDSEPLSSAQWINEFVFDGIFNVPGVIRDKDFYLFCETLNDLEEYGPDAIIMVIPVDTTTFNGLSGTGFPAESYGYILSGDYLIIGNSDKYYIDDNEVYINFDVNFAFDKAVVAKIKFDSLKAYSESIKEAYNENIKLGQEAEYLKAITDQLDFYTDNISSIEIALYHDNDATKISGILNTVPGSVLERAVVKAQDNRADDLLKLLPNRDYVLVSAAHNRAVMEELEDEYGFIEQLTSLFFGFDYSFMPENELKMYRSFGTLYSQFIACDGAVAVTGAYDTEESPVVIGIFKIKDAAAVNSSLSNIADVFEMIKSIRAEELERAKEEEAIRFAERREGDDAWQYDYYNDFDEYWDDYLSWQYEYYWSDVTLSYDDVNDLFAGVKGDFVKFAFSIDSDDEEYSNEFVFYIAYLDNNTIAVVMGKDTDDAALINTLKDTAQNINENGANGFTTSAAYKAISEELLPNASDVTLINTPQVPVAALDIIYKDSSDGQTAVYKKLLKVIADAVNGRGLGGIRSSQSYTNKTVKFEAAMDDVDFNFLLNLGTFLASPSF